MFFFILEAAVAGVLSIGFEVYIIIRQGMRGRSLWYYYPIPIVNGVWQLAAAAYPHSLHVNMAATLFAAATTFNLYNTLVPNVMMSHHKMLFDTDPQILVQDLYCHRYSDFSPNLLTFQLLFAFVSIFHVSVRAFAVAELLD